MDRKSSIDGAVQNLISVLFPIIDGFIIKHGDKGWEIFCQKFGTTEKYFQDTNEALEGISLASLGASGSAEEARILMGEFVKRTLEGRPMPEGLQLWVSQGLINILKGETSAIKAFGMKSKPGPQKSLSEKIQIACYLKHRRNHVKFEEAEVQTGARFNTDPRNASKTAASIIIPEISDLTLETLSRIDLSPLF